MGRKERGEKGIGGGKTEGAGRRRKNKKHNLLVFYDLGQKQFDTGLRSHCDVAKLTVRDCVYEEVSNNNNNSNSSNSNNNSSNSSSSLGDTCGTGKALLRCVVCVVLSLSAAMLNGQQAAYSELNGNTHTRTHTRTYTHTHIYTQVAAASTAYLTLITCPHLIFTKTMQLELRIPVCLFLYTY